MTDQSPAHLHFDQCASTNDLAFEFGPSELEKNRTPFLVVTSDEQTRGRGRQGREWTSSHTGNIYCSLFFKGTSVRLPLTLVPLAAAVAILSTLEALLTEVDPLFWETWRVKWPNDILVESPATSEALKIAGILCESRFSGHQLQGLVVGVGFNVYSAPLPTSACFIDLLKEFVPAHQVQSLLDSLKRQFPVELGHQLAYWLDGSVDQIKTAWLHFAKWDRYPRLRTHLQDQGEIELHELTLLNSGGIRGRCTETAEIKELLF